MRCNCLGAQVVMREPPVCVVYGCACLTAHVASRDSRRRQRSLVTADGVAEIYIGGGGGGRMYMVLTWTANDFSALLLLDSLWRVAAREEFLRAQAACRAQRECCAPQRRRRVLRRTERSALHLPAAARLCGRLPRRAAWHAPQRRRRTRTRSTTNTSETTARTRLSLHRLRHRQRPPCQRPPKVKALTRRTRTAWATAKKATKRRRSSTRGRGARSRGAVCAHVRVRGVAGAPGFR